MAANVTVQVVYNRFPSLIAKMALNGNAASYNGARKIYSLSRANAPVRTGHLRDSHLVTKASDGLWEVQVGAYYAAWVNNGTQGRRKNPFFTKAIQSVAGVFKYEVAGTLFN